MLPLYQTANDKTIQLRAKLCVFYRICTFSFFLALRARRHISHMVKGTAKFWLAQKNCFKQMTVSHLPRIKEFCLLNGE